MKTISFITPCFNDGNTIEKEIRSIRDQDLPDIEIVVVNDGSTDDSKKILEGLKSEGLIDQLIHLEKNSGACVARNTGAKAAQGKYFSFLPADAILYPGMARIWYETLEEHPDYDFLYGGYEFIDEDGEPVGQQITGQPFDPYLLTVSNYIDGSFPIKAESFWKFAEKVNQPDGLWDKNIISLQDWDFWLSVAMHGGKGIYIQDIFFGTTLPHPGGLSYDSANNWIERTEAIKNKHGLPSRKLCVASMGAGWHARRIAYILQADFKEMPSFKPHTYDALYLIGFYPEFAKQHGDMFLNNLWKPQDGITSAKKIIHFVGSDIWQLFNVSMNALKFYRDYFKVLDATILCEAEFTKKELAQLGIEATVVPIPPATLYEPRPLPKQFTVACYQPLVNEQFYRPAEMIEIAKRLPEVRFKFFGNPKRVGKDPALPDNIEFCGYITDMNTFISECSAIMRFPLHDGLPLSVLEFILAGRYSIQSVPIENSFVVEEFNVDKVVMGIKEIQEKAQQGINQTGSDYWRKELDHKKYIDTIYNLMPYDPKEYWESRATHWSIQAQKSGVEAADVKSLLDKVEHKSLIDIGCGDGRWYEFLQKEGVEKYTGIDISGNLVKAAQMRFPQAEFIESKVEDYEPKEKADLVFSYTCLEHIKEEDFPKAVEQIKKMGKKLLLIEPTNFISRYYCISHDYEKYFKVVEKVKLADKEIMLCDLQ